jgi:hypothetical protein
VGPPAGYGAEKKYYEKNFFVHVFHLLIFLLHTTINIILNQVSFFDHRIIDNECRFVACGKKSRKYKANPVNQPSPIVSAIAQKTVNTAFINPFIDPFEFAAKNRVDAGHEHERHRQYDE